MDKIQLEIFEKKINKQENPFKCSICDNYLSVAPIYAHATIGNICGRKSCEKFAKTDGAIRQNAYEALSMSIEFPCCNKENGCDQILPWEEIAKHEEECKFGYYSLCPFSLEKFRNSEEKSCEWKGDISEFLEHMKEHHPSSEFKDCFTMDICNPVKSDQVFFTVVDEDIVVVLALVDTPSVSHWNVWAGSKVHHNLKYKYEFKSVRGRSENTTKVLIPRSLKPAFYKSKFDNRWFRLSSDHTTNFFESSNSFVIKFYLNEFLIGPTCLPAEVIIPSPRIVECDKCHTIIGSSYYLCSNTNCQRQICMDCKTIGACCYYKSGDLIDEGYQLSLQTVRMISKINQSFRYCEVCKTPEKFSLPHLEEHHKGSLLKLETIYSWTNPSNIYFFYDDHWFFLSTKITNDNLSISMKCCDNNNIEYSYELKLIGSEFPHSGITLSRVVFPRFIDIIDGDTYTAEALIPRKLLQQLIEGILKFKMKIMKI